MPPLEEMDRHQKAVLLEYTGLDSESERTFAAPVEIDVRWTWTRSYSTDAQGNKIALDAKVVTGQQVPVGSLMYLGTEDEWLGTGSASNDSELCEVAVERTGTDIKHRFTRYSYSLKRYRTNAR